MNLPSGDPSRTGRFPGPGVPGRPRVHLRSSVAGLPAVSLRVYAMDLEDVSPSAWSGPRCPGW